MNISDYIWLIPALPLMTFLIISVFARKLSNTFTSILAVLSVSVSALLTIITGIGLLKDNSGSMVYSDYIYTWMSIGGFDVSVSFLLDPLSLVFCFVITFVGALIHIYSVEFMQGDEGFSRFFAYMNLFVGSMLILVLADNLLLLYLGWEGVGLCSYLLIGFWYKDPKNVAAANKAFIVTRIGDTAMILGIFMLMSQFGTLNIREIMQNASESWKTGSPVAITTASLLLIGALGKSAQLPLHTWLPDAMAGPSPVSALIHAATMVTAGVYLITRTHTLFILAPVVMTIIAAIGAITLIMAGTSALFQTDLKRILAYSTISQIGYMFLAIGIGAWSASVFHFMTHAFFKALLFLAGGAVIHLLNDEHNIFKMGGLRKKMQFVYITFLTGAASLAALPFITAGFYSKDEIIWFGWAGERGSPALWLAGITGSFLTSLYIFRLVFVVFFGNENAEHVHRAGRIIKVPIAILAFFSIFAGFIEMPGNISHVHLLSDFVNNTLPGIVITANEKSEVFFQLISAIIAIGGTLLAWFLFGKKRVVTPQYNTGFSRFFHNGWEIDTIYNTLVVRPYRWLAEINRNDFLDNINRIISVIASFLNRIMSLSQNGQLRWYVLFVTIGVFVILAFMLSI
ncbi:MAG TPA: NADH-quinone oxidoreductase subunit L [Bacteroidales bacterium]|nr:NADH-quinone oxidoreductase subunit L [Bacteroidales bacterium]